MIKKSIDTKINCSKVYFVPVFEEYNSDKDLFALGNILQHRMYHLISRFREKDVIALKLCENYPVETSKYVCSFARLLSENGVTGFVGGTSRRHEDYNDNGIVRAHSVISMCDDLPEPCAYMALDGMYGEHEITRKNDKRLEEEVFLAGELPNLDGLLSVSCILKNSEDSRMGSIVNLGHGLASKKGKTHQLTESCPQVNIRKCYTCRRCVRICPSHAITIGEGHVVIDPKKCIKCGRCVEIARYGGITYDWNATPEHYNESVARHAKGVMDVLDNRVICINVMLDVNDQNTRFAGAMVSSDSVAVDSATADFCADNDFLPDHIIQELRERIAEAKSSNVGASKHSLTTVAY